MASHWRFYKRKVPRILSVANSSVISTEVMKFRLFFTWYFDGFLDLSLYLTLTHRKKKKSFPVLTWPFWGERLRWIFPESFLLEREFYSQGFIFHAAMCSLLCTLQCCNSICLPPFYVGRRVFLERTQSNIYYKI
jgi:hypothetical protein